MKTSSFRNRLLVAVLASTTQILAADLDVRVADGTDAAMLVNVDAIRQSGADISGFFLAAIDESVRAGTFGEKTGKGMKDFGRMLAKKAKDAGVMPEDVHWMLSALQAKEFFVNDRHSITQQVWSVAMAVDGCDWERIGNVAVDSGLEWQKDSVFGHRVFTAVAKRGKLTRYNVRCVPGGDKMAYFGAGASREWECYNAGAFQDARFSSIGRLAGNEILRIVLVDDKPLSKMARHHYRGLYPLGAEPVPDRVRCFRLSLFFDGQGVSSELVFACADELDAGVLAKAYLDMKATDGIPDMEVSCKGNVVDVKAGNRATKSALIALFGSIGSLLDFFETFFR